jgi:DNA invertase Pin-like site-specific DNA recombinase
MHPKDTEGLGADLAALFAPPSARDLAREPFRIHIYVRVSSPEQTRRKGKDGKRAAADATDAKQRERDEELSPATQEKRCRDWADELTEEVTRGRKVVVTVHVEAFTSRVLWGRPVFRTIMDEIAAGRVDLLVCLKPERLGANSEQQAILRFMLRQQGGELAYVTQGYEDTVMGRVMATLWAEFNTMRLESLREQFRRRQVAKVDSGRVLHSSRPPYGCAWADDEHEAYVFVSELVPYVVLIFEWYADGLSRRAIARTLNDRGVPPPGGGKGWYDRSVEVILENPIYVGRPQSYRYAVDVLPGLTRSGKLRRRTRRRTDADEEQPREATKGLAPGAVPPVGEALWERVQARMADVAAGTDVAARGGRPPEAPDDWLLRGGHILCGTCKRPLQCGTTGGKHPTQIYVCRANGHGVTACERPTSISKHLAEARVWERVVAYTQQPETIERVLAAYEASLAGDGGAGDAAAAEAARMRLLVTGREIAGLSAAFRDPDLGARSRAAVKAQLDELEASAARQERELAELEARLEAGAQAARERLEYAEAVRRIGAHLAEPPAAWPPAFRRMAVVGTDVEATVAPSAVRGWQARERAIETTFPPDRERYAALAAALEGASQEGADSLRTAHSYLWQFAT